MNRDTYESWLMSKVEDDELSMSIALEMLNDFDADHRKSRDEDRMIANAERQFYGKN